MLRHATAHSAAPFHLQNFLKIVLSIVLHLILAIFVVYREWVNLVMVSAWLVSVNIPYRTVCNISVLFLLTNVLIASLFG